ncbi:MAG: CHAT domain-containing protein [Saprospiraceae bacterium]
MFKRTLLSSLFFCFSFFTQAQFASHTIDYEKLRTYSDAALDSLVDQIYNEIDMSDSIAIYDLYDNLDFQKIYHGLDFNKLFRKINWNKAMQDVRWNAIMKDFDFDQMLDSICSTSHTLFPEGSPTPSTMNPTSLMNQQELLKCFQQNDPFALMQALDMYCVFNKFGPGADVADLVSFKMVCELSSCVNLNKLLAGVDWGCIFSSMDMNAYFKNYDFNAVFKNLDTLKTKNRMPVLSNKVRDHPLLKQINPDSLFKHFNINIDPEELFRDVDVSTLYQNLYDNLIKKSLQSKNASKSQMVFFGTMIKNTFGDTKAARYYTVYHFLMLDVINQTHKNQFDLVYQQQLIMKDILIHAKAKGLFDDLSNNVVSVRKIIGDHFEEDNLAKNYQNSSFTLGQVGKFKASLVEIKQAIKINLNLVEKFNTPYPVDDFFSYTYLDTTTRQQKQRELQITDVTINVHQLSLLNKVHPKFIKDLLDNGHYQQALESYYLLKDILLDKNKENQTRPSFVPSNGLVDKQYGLKVLKGIHHNIADVLQKQIEVRSNGSTDLDMRALDKHRAANYTLNKFEVEQQIVNLYNHLGSTYASMYDLENSLHYFRQAWKMLTKLKNIDYLVFLQPGIGDPKKDYLNKMTFYVNLQSNIASMLILQKDYAEATSTLEEAIPILKEIAAKEKSSKAKAKVVELDRDIFTIYYLLGKLALLQGNQKEAFKQLTLCQQIAKQWQEPLHFYYSHYQLGEYYSTVMKPDSALKHYALATQNAKAINFTQGLSTLSFRQGLIYHKKGDQTKAKKHFDAAVEIANTYAQYGLLSSIYTTKGYLAKTEKKYRQAANYFSMAIDITEDNIFPNLLGESSRQLATEYNFNAYTGAVSTALALGKEKEAFRYTQQFKSRTFNELLLRKLLAKPTPLNETLQLTLDNLYARLNQNQLRLLENPSAAIRSQQKKLLAELKFTKLKVLSSSEDFHPVAQINTTDIQAQLKPQQAFIEYFIGDSIYAFVLTKARTKVFTLAPAKAVVTDLYQLKALYNKANKKDAPKLIRKKIALQYWAPKGDLFQLLRRTHQNIFAPITKDPILKNITTLTIAQDAELYFLPFEMLIVDGSKETWGDYNYVIDNYRINYYQSANTFQHYTKLFSKEEQIYDKSLLVVAKGNFNPYKKLNNLRLPDFKNIPFKQSSFKSLLEKQATLKNLKRSTQTTSYNTIYLSTHSVINAVPELSYLALSDGPLSLYNIFNLNLDCQTMVLSACQTGRGTFQRGGGLMGFSRGLMYAGAKSLIVSLWSVDDESSTQLFDDFLFSAPLKGNPSMKIHDSKISLKNAKRKVNLYGEDTSDLINTGHPFFWAAFVYYGPS